jgi:beta-N-acetylhexosaminidase
VTRVSRVPGRTILVAALLLIGAAAMAGGCGGDDSEGGDDGVVLGEDEPPARRRGDDRGSERGGRPAVPLERLVGQKIMARYKGPEPSSDLLRRVRAGQVGGVILFPDNRRSDDQLEKALAQLQDEARKGGSPGLLVSVDQEGGQVSRFPGPPDMTARQIGRTGSAETASDEGSATGRYLARLGVNVDLAPVVDVPTSRRSFITERAFSMDTGLTGELGAAFAAGLQEAGVAATAKHFPGIGASIKSTDVASVEVKPTPQQFTEALTPFEETVESGGAALVMVATAVFPSYDRRNPAAFSREIVRGELRGKLGFEGVIITDDLEGRAVTAVASPSRAAVAATQAGVDVVLFAKSENASKQAYAALLEAARSGRVDRTELEESYARIDRLQTDFAGGP